jgi:hypothetical protein
MLIILVIFILAEVDCGSLPALKIRFLECGQSQAEPSICSWAARVASFSRRQFSGRIAALSMEARFILPTLIIAMYRWSGRSTISI